MLKSVYVPHTSRAKGGKPKRQRLGCDPSDPLPLELVGEEGWLIFTGSLKRWRRLRRTERILNTWGKGEREL